MYHRLFHRDDLRECYSLLPPGFRASGLVRSRLVSLWQSLLTGRDLHGGVVIDPEEPARSIAAFGMTVFLETAFVEEYLGSPAPDLSARVYERILAGRSPVVPARALAAANAGGRLNLLILHFGIRRSDPLTSRDLAIISTAHASFRMAHEGYRVARVLQEVSGSAEVELLRAGGFRLLSDYAEAFARSGGAIPPPERRPFLMGAARDDPESRLPGSVLSYLFQHREPRFGFSPAEQRVLLRTVMDETDEGIAEALGISRDAVKKVWRRIYQRVDAVDPSLLDPAGNVDVADAAGRARDKRRRLIRYLRSHLEELRPFRARDARGRAAGRSALLRTQVRRA